MKLKVFQVLILILSGSCLISCSNDKKERTLAIGTGSDVKVSLQIRDLKGIKLIEFKSDKEIQQVGGNVLKNYKQIDYGFNGGGEGTFKLFVYTNSDTLQSEHYVEGGYHVKLICDSSRVETIDHIGDVY